MRQSLWPSSKEEHATEIARYFKENTGHPVEVLIALDEQGNSIGFIELSIRAYAEGCVSTKVPYIEGWFVEPNWRRKGIGLRLIRAAEEWGRSKGCTEIASDSELDNEVSQLAHRAAGFIEAVRVVCFKKNL
jgi:aminoglycoside 6'-N-acetyltransferase I